MKTALNFLKLTVAIILGLFVISLCVDLVFSYYQYEQRVIGYLSGWLSCVYAYWIINKSGLKK